MDPNLKQPDSKFFIGTRVMGFLGQPFHGPVEKIEYEQGRVFYKVTFNNEKFKLEEKYLILFEPTRWYSALEKWNEYLRIGALQQRLLHEIVEMMRPVR